MPWCFGVQQVPEEIERVMVGIEAYLRIRRRVSDIGFSIFGDNDDSDKALDGKVLNAKNCLLSLDGYWMLLICFSFCLKENRILLGLGGRE